MTKSKCFNEYYRVQKAIYTNLLGIKDAMFSVIDRFDGKVVNKRFITALEDAMPQHTFPHLNGKMLPNVTFDIDYDTFRIKYASTIDGCSDLYLNGFNTTISLYRVNLKNERLNSSSFKYLLEKEIFDTLIKRISELDEEFSNYDMVSDAYKQAYEILKSVKKYSSLCHYADSNEPWMRYLKGVIVV